MDQYWKSHFSLSPIINDNYNDDLFDTFVRHEHLLPLKCIFALIWEFNECLLITNSNVWPSINNNFSLEGEERGKKRKSIFNLLFKHAFLVIL